MFNRGKKHDIEIGFQKADMGSCLFEKKIKPIALVSLKYHLSPAPNKKEIMYITTTAYSKNTPSSTVQTTNIQ